MESSLLTRSALDLGDRVFCCSQKAVSYDLPNYLLYTIRKCPMTLRDVLNHCYSKPDTHCQSCYRNKTYLLNTPFVTYTGSLVPRNVPLMQALLRPNPAWKECSRPTRPRSGDFERAVGYANKSVSALNCQFYIKPRLGVSNPFDLKFDKLTILLSQAKSIVLQL